MRDRIIIDADEKDIEFAEGLQILGVNRNAARVITYLKEVESGSSRDIEIAMGLKQSEVSMAMRELRARGWIEERDARGDRKGRPQKIYSLRMSIDEILNYCEEMANRKATSNMEAIQKLKELSSI